MGVEGQLGVYAKTGWGALRCLCRPLPSDHEYKLRNKSICLGGGAEIDNIVNKLTHVTRLHKHLSLDDCRHLTIQTPVGVSSVLHR